MLCLSIFADVGLKHGLLEVSNGRLVGILSHVAVVWSCYTGIREEQIDEALFLSDLVDNFQKRFLVGNISNYRLDSPVHASFGGCFQCFFATSDDLMPNGQQVSSEEYE